MTSTLEVLQRTKVPAPMGLYARFGKRIFDLLVGVVVLLLAFPILLVTAVVLRITLGPGVILSQPRLGMGGRTFRCYKFRTMTHDRRTADHLTWDGIDRRETHKSADDPRHTDLGRALRKFSVDELPQLINLVRGDMSLVGPRPELACVASHDFVAHPRHQVRPGLTGPFQLSPLRSAGSLRDGLGYDEVYLRRQSFGYDLGILFRTIRVVLVGTGS